MRTGARLGPLFAHVADELVERLAADGRRYARALDLGCREGALAACLPADDVIGLDAGEAFARAAAAVLADEDRLPFTERAFDLIVSLCVLQTVNDLPGAFVQLRRALRPGGRFLGVLVGGDSLGPLRRALFEAEEALTGGVRARVHPMVDPREAPSLLQRAGFANPVVDVEPLTLRYRDLAGLAADLRAAGETGSLADRAPLRRDVATAAAARFESQAEANGRVAVRVELIWLAGGAPEG